MRDNEIENGKDKTLRSRMVEPGQDILLTGVTYAIDDCDSEGYGIQGSKVHSRPSVQHSLGGWVVVIVGD